MIRILIPSLLLAALSAGGGVATAASRTPAQTAAACTGASPVAITQLGFVPSSATPGENAKLTGTVTNCTSQPLAINELLTSQLLGTAQNCIVSDPLYWPTTLAAGGTLNVLDNYIIPAACTASGIQANVKISDPTNKIVYAQASAVLPIEQPKPVVACHVAYTVQSEWQGGFTAALSITDTGEVGVDGWTLTFTFGGDQKVTNAWGATASQSGAIVTLTNVSYDGAIAPGGTLTGVGMQGTWTSSDAAPTGFNLNGTLCS